jgi:hypothetical protein
MRIPAAAHERRNCSRFPCPAGALRRALLTHFVDFHGFGENEFWCMPISTEPWYIDTRLSVLKEGSWGYVGNVKEAKYLCSLLSAVCWTFALIAQRFKAWRLLIDIFQKRSDRFMRIPKKLTNSIDLSKKSPATFPVFLEKMRSQKTHSQLWLSKGLCRTFQKKPGKVTRLSKKKVQHVCRTF